MWVLPSQARYAAIAAPIPQSGPARSIRASSLGLAREEGQPILRRTAFVEACR
jgi:hypothetical protein